MPRRLVWLIALFTLLLTGLPSGPAPAKTLTIALLTAPDIQGQMEPFTSAGASLGGMARLAGAIKSAQARYPGRCLVVASGDDLMGRYFLQFHGRAMYRTMTAAGFDIGCLGNHEFDLGPAALAEGQGGRGFPLVNSNLTFMPQSGLQGQTTPRTMLGAGGLNIGFFGLMTPDLAAMSNTDGQVIIDGDLKAVARREVAKLKAMGADLVVAVTHIGLDSDMALAASVDGIDVIIGGHSHDLIPSGQEKIITTPSGGRTIVVQAGDRGKYLGVLELYLPASPSSDLHGRSDDHKWTVIPIDASTPEDPAVAALVAEYRAQLPPSRVLAQSQVELDITRATVRGGEAPIGNLVADIIRDRFESQLAFINGGNLRGDRIIPAGPVTTDDVDTLLPFNNNVDIVGLTGSTVIETLEYGLSGLDQLEGRFLQVSGMRFTARGGRVISAEILNADGGYSPLDPNATYSVATNSYLAGGGDGFTVLKEKATYRRPTYVSLNSLVQSELAALKTVAPQVEGRINLQ